MGELSKLPNIGKTVEEQLGKGRMLTNCFWLFTEIPRMDRLQEMIGNRY